MLNLISSNIRFESQKDGPNNWPFRKATLSELLLSKTPQILGTQEGREPQLRDFDHLLHGLELVDHHRDWIEERMYPCLWYDPKKLKLENSQDFWLSETPSIAGSKSFDSAFPRLVTVATFKDLENSQQFIVSNCHLDHLKEETRLQQIEVLATSLGYYNQNNLPVILMGDFNSPATGPVRQKLTKLIDLKDPWLDLKKKEETTFHHFHGDSYDPQKGARIDWILYHPKFKVIDAHILKDHKDGLYPSDHYPIWTQLSW